MINIFEKLASLHSTSPEEALEIDEAAEKRERIKFHRQSVRNGPVNFRTPTNGQLRRAAKRDLARETKKARRRQVRKHFDERYEQAVLRAHLQHAGVLAYDSGREVDGEQAVASITWLVQHFADAPEGQSVEVTGEVVAQSLQSALNHWQTILGLEKTPLSPAYQLPVATSA